MSFNDHRARAVREATYGKDNREPIARSCEAIRDNRVKRVNEIDEFHKERVVAATTQPITGSSEYYTLVLTRANGK